MKNKKELTTKEVLHKKNMQRNKLYQTRIELLKHWITETKDKIPNYKLNKVSDNKENKDNNASDNSISYLLAFADFQEDGSGFSYRNFEVLLAKMKKIIQEKKITHLHILDGGDQIDGVLRIADLQNNAVQVRQAIIYQTALGNFLTEIAKLVAFDFYSLLSNHGQIRAIGMKRDLLPQDDWAYLFANTMKHTFSNSDTHIIHDAVEEKIQKIEGFKFLFLHGHQYPSVSKLESFFTKSNSYYNGIDFLISGHYHHFRVVSTQRKSKYNKKAIILPAGDVRTNKRNEKHLRVSSAPSGLLMKIEKKVGINEFKLIPFV